MPPAMMAPITINISESGREALESPDFLGGGNGSPSMTFMILLSPTLMPPKKSPSLNRGTMTSSMMRFAVISGSAPSRP